MTQLLNERIQHALKTLKLEQILEELPMHIQASEERQLPLVESLDTMLENELIARTDRAMRTRMKQAGFPIIKTLESYNFDAQLSLDRRVINELATLNFIERKECIALLGPPGLGKTHIGIGLGVKAIQAGYRAYFVSAQDLLDQIRLSSFKGVPGHKQKHLSSIPLLIIDELGYVEFDQASATWLFQLLTHRHEKYSTILTSNKPFSDWGKIFVDVSMAGALLDRFLHHCHVLTFKGESYRMRTRLQQGAKESRQSGGTPVGS